MEVKNCASPPAVLEGEAGDIAYRRQTVVVDDEIHKYPSEALQLAVTDTVDSQHLVFGHRHRR
ncbi:hypothetical protein CHQ57_21295 [Aeromonas salmonicida]|nr:hypothetical protein CHQ57_21295 [Aeromonas salmonicida]